MVESVNTGIPVSLSSNRDVVKEIAALTSFCAEIKPAEAQLRDAAPAKSSIVKGG